MQSRRALWLSLAMTALAAGMGASGAAAADNTIKLVPSATQVANGATFTVKVVQNGTVATSGTSVSITFNKAVVQVTTITRGAAFAAAPLFIAGDAAAVAAANQKGKLQNVAAAFFPPTSVPAGEQEFITVGFKAVGCGVVELGVPTGKVDSTLLDGREKTYGASLKLSASGATVTVCDGTAGASGAPPASGDASVGPSDGSLSGESPDPDASASAGPAGGSSTGGAAPSNAPTTINSSPVASAEQSGWLNFALAALAVAAAGLATLIIVLTVIAISAAVVGVIVAIRVWRRSTERTRAAADAAGVVAAEPSETAPAGDAAERGAMTDVPTTAIPLPTAQQP